MVLYNKSKELLIAPSHTTFTETYLNSRTYNTLCFETGVYFFWPPPPPKKMKHWWSRTVRVGGGGGWGVKKINQCFFVAFSKFFSMLHFLDICPLFSWSFINICLRLFTTYYIHISLKFLVFSRFSDMIQILTWGHVHM